MHKPEPSNPNGGEHLPQRSAELADSKDEPACDRCGIDVPHPIDAPAASPQLEVPAPDKTLGDVELASCSRAESEASQGKSSVRLRSKTFQLEGRFEASARPESVINMSTVLTPVEADKHFASLTDIRGFLARQSGVATKLWFDLLAEACPELKEICIEMMLLSLVSCAHDNRASGVADTDFVEYWAGSGALTKEFIRVGQRCFRLDKAYSNHHSCSTAEGLRLWLVTLCSVRRGGLIWCGTQCSSFLRMCMSRSKRTAENAYLGDTSRAFVVEGNRQMVVLSIIAFVALLVGVDFILEQPTQSLLPCMEPLKSTLAFIGATRTVTWLGEFGAESPKPLQLLHSSSKYAALARTRPRPSEEKISLVEKLPGGKFRGKPDALKKSQVYPERFAAAVVRIAVGGGD